MNIRKIKTKVFGGECSLEIMDFTKSDGKKWKFTFDLWRGLKMGMRDYKSREPNFPGDFLKSHSVFGLAHLVLYQHMDYQILRLILSTQKQGEQNKLKPVV